jgi:hypothetical protein
MVPPAKAKSPTKGQRTREALKAVVVGLVNEKPLAEIKVGDLCERSGLSVGAFYFHFQGRDDALDLPHRRGRAARPLAGLGEVRGDADPRRPPSGSLHALQPRRRRRYGHGARGLGL